MGDDKIRLKNIVEAVYCNKDEQLVDVNIKCVRCKFKCKIDKQKLTVTCAFNDVENF